MITQINQRFYGYKHWTLEAVPRCFNVGRGLKVRPFDRFNGRNHKWYAIVKRFGWRVEVCVGPVTNDEACAWEIKNIALMGTFSIDHSHYSADIGCNFSLGGRTNAGYKQRPESIAKRVATRKANAKPSPLKGKKRPPCNDMWCQNISASKRGEKNPNFGKKQSSEWIAKRLATPRTHESYVRGGATRRRTNAVKREAKRIREEIEC